MRFRKLKLVGFKSFVEPAELRLEPGLTGIVGPNGCGKSNLLEAFRWVMGENSYKSMRASAMDDVIFSGSASRPARSMAEVILTLDNADHSAPPPWRDFEILEVSRRLVREKGSTYRINGREVRARDVQLLFADAGTGARSPALVRQGRIAELINARPQARRRLLEEAAGIAGLYGRRREAELKLDAAEHNLARLEDVLVQLEQQVKSLSRQARQAARYRELSDSVREHEAALLWRLWREAADHHAAAESALAAASKARAEAVYQASLKAREVELAKEKIAPLRAAAAERAAAVQRLKLELEGLSRQEKAAGKRRRELGERIAQAERDIARAEEDAKDAEAALARLEEEAQALRALPVDDSRRAELAHRLQEAQAAVAQWRQRLSAARTALAEREAERKALEARIEEQERIIARLKKERATLQADLERIKARLDSAAAENARTAVHRAEAALRAAQERLQALDEERERARKAHEEARAAVHDRERAAHALRAEIEAIERMLGPVSADERPLLDALKVTAGFEKALAAALGDDVEAALDDEQAASRWRALPLLDLPALPEKARPLAEVVTAPPALARRLASIGIVPDREAGDALQEHLLPGQRLVSPAGDLWRWDGFVSAAEAPTAAARRLQARNRLAELHVERARAERILEQARAAHARARARLEQADERVRAARADLKQARRAVDDARHEWERLRAAEADVQRRIAACEASGERLDRELAAACARLNEARAALAALPDTDALKARLAAQEQGFNEASDAERELRLQLDAIEREARLRRHRLQRIEQEKAAWSRRRQRAGSHRAELRKRLARLRDQLAELERAPQAIAEKRERLFAMLKEAEGAARSAADALAEAESGLSGLERDWHRAENRLAEAKAAYAAAEAHRQAAGERLEEVLASVRERAQCRPEHLLAKTRWTEDDCPERAELERALARAREARERLGAVNLRAEVELREAKEELDRLLAEREDVQQAVNRLRGAIASLNREGRKRLLEAFERVNGHFAALFATLFGGGKAHLELIEDDDPLQAGLEIFARPPGKRLQTLSLLSGGEQTLTALALIFAVFLTNPSPICVLDEVDAPLDEHNVERFCNLLDDMLKRASTDFLVITHHPLTMARMHRLYGVTMMEPGVSRLVSVDLKTAESLREAS